MNKKLQRLLDKELTRKEFLGVIGLACVSLFGVTGLLRELSSYAATPFVSTEPDTGTPTNGATVVSDTAASGDKAIKFGQDTTTTHYVPATPGSYKPSSATTGYAPYGITLTPYGGQFGAIVNGTLTLATAGVTISGFDIPARIVIRAANITIRKCRVRGNATLANNSALVDCNNAAVVNCIVEDCLLVPDHPSVWWNGMIGHDYTAQRNNVYHTVDGFGIYNIASRSAPNNVKLYANYVHDLTYYSPDPNHASDTPVSKTHNDCVQLQGNSNTDIRWNNFQGFFSTTVGDTQYTSTNRNAQGGYNVYHPSVTANAVLQVTQNVGPVTNLIFDSNWCDGGGGTLNMASKGDVIGNTIGSITNNKFGRGQYYKASGGDTTVTFLSSGFKYVSTTGNVYEDNGNPITLRIT
ncbi:MAG TPA: hypothetical protein VF575_00195 [Candidatus Saccharimonadales bacterium]|jgi:hypothetical protein